MTKSARATKLTLLLMLAIGCSFSPRNNERLAHAWDPITWAGASITPDQTVFANVFSPVAVGYTVVTTATTSHTPWTTDAAGATWYSWSVGLNPPQNAGYWDVSSANTLRIRLATATGGLGLGSNASIFATFDAGSATDQCIQNNQSGGGVQIINTCKSPQSGLVSVTAPCGTLNEACCLGSCNSGLRCEGSSSTSFGRCHGNAGATCSSDGDCAAGTSCKSGVCTAPKQAGGSCSVDSDCVSSTSCRNGVCSIPCTQGGSCTSSRPGVCAAGTWQCTPTAKTCQSIAAPSPEVCDSRDNDCNGRTDDIAASACTTHPSECSPRGSSFTVTGHNTCSGGRLQCVATAGKDYCTAPGMTANGLNCGGAFGENCSRDEDCAPNSVCRRDFQAQYTSCNVVDICRTDPGCWQPSERGKSCLP